MAEAVERTLFDDMVGRPLLSEANCYLVLAAKREPMGDEGTGYRGGVLVRLDALHEFAVIGDLLGDMLRHRGDVAEGLAVLQTVYLAAMNSLMGRGLSSP